MRARWIKPEFFRDRKMATVGPLAALVYQALWCLADDGGVAPADPDRIHAEMFYLWPTIGLPEVSEALRQLSAVGRLSFYQRGDDWFAAIVNFDRHQQVHNPSKFRNLPNIKDLTPTLPQWCGRAEAGLPPSSPPRHLDTQTPRHPPITSNEVIEAEASHVASTPQVDDLPEPRLLAGLRPLLYPKGGQPAPGSKGDVTDRDVTVVRRLHKRGIPHRDILDAVAEFRRQVDAGDHRTFVAPGDHFTMRAIAKPGLEYDTIRELLHAVHKREAAQGRGRRGPMADIKAILAKGGV